MLLISGVAFIGLCIWHEGRPLWRVGVAIMLGVALGFIGWRGLRRPVAHPDWLTPYLFCADTEYHLGNPDVAKKYLDTFEAQKGYAYRDAPCPKIEDNVRRELTKLQ
jgi:hypothetical protein